MDLIRKKLKEQKNIAGDTVVLEIRKYAREVFYKNLWDANPELVKSRGSVFVNGKQVVMPMKKTFYYGENGVAVDLPKETMLKIYRKYNGYMLNLTFVENVGFIFSTTGDAYVFGNEEKDNKYLTMWADFLSTFNVFEYYQKIANDKELWYKGLTVTFEVCHPDDPHIIDEKAGIYPLCYQTGGKTYPIGDYEEATVEGLMELCKVVKHEGFMVYNMEDELLFKAKSQFYLYKKWVMRGNAKRVFDSDFKHYMDEEYYPIVLEIRKGYNRTLWDAMSEAEKASVFEKIYRGLYE